MKPKGLLVAVALLAVLGGLTWWSNKKQAAASKSTDTTVKILSVPDDQLQEIKLTKKGGEPLDLRRENGKWRITAPKPYSADQDAVGTLTSNLTTLNADKVIEDKAADFAPYGLNAPSLDVQVTKKDGKTEDLLVGDDTPTGSGAYARLANDPRVFTIGSYVKSSFDKGTNDLRDKRLVTFDQDKLTRVALEAKGQSIEFGKNSQNEWTIVKPRPLRADGTAVDTLIGKLRDAKMDLTVPEEAKKAAAAFASGTKVAVASTTDPSGNQTLEVHKDKDKNYYAKSSAVEGVYKIASDVGDGLDKSLDDFRNKKLFDFGFSDPSKLDVQGATYTKSGDKWMSGSKTMDNSTVQTLIDKLRDLAATKFADKGGGNPVFQATVTSDSGKRVEKATISKQGDQYFAQRENEPSIYELDATAVDDLQKAASGVKEQAPPQPKKK